jgi:FhuF 2Fe-2S C-terminal domain
MAVRERDIRQIDVRHATIDEVGSHRCRSRSQIAPLPLGMSGHFYQRRTTCCRYYLQPEGSLCPSCPLVSQEEREVRNLEWMKKQLSREPR